MYSSYTNVQKWLSEKQHTATKSSCAFMFDIAYSSVPNRHACTFINFEKKIPPARPYFGLHVYWFWEKVPPCTSIPSCTFIVIGMLLLNWNLSLNNTSPYYIVWRQKCFLPYFGTLWDWLGIGLGMLWNTLGYLTVQLLIFQKISPLHVYWFSRNPSCTFNVF